MVQQNVECMHRRRGAARACRDMLAAGAAASCCSYVCASPLPAAVCCVCCAQRKQQRAVCVRPRHQKPCRRRRRCRCPDAHAAPTIILSPPSTPRPQPPQPLLPPRDGAVADRPAERRQVVARQRADDGRVPRRHDPDGRLQHAQGHQGRRHDQDVGPRRPGVRLASPPPHSLCAVGWRGRWC